MDNLLKNVITITASVNAPIEKVWAYFTLPEHITRWNHASDEWHSPFAENDLQPGGKFSYRMEAKDGSFSFDFWGIYDTIIHQKLIAYTLGDSRKVSVGFTPVANTTIVTENFEAETENSVELQQAGWQAILDNFKKHVEVTV